MKLTRPGALGITASPATQQAGRRLGKDLGARIYPVERWPRRRGPSIQRGAGSVSRIRQARQALPCEVTRPRPWPIFNRRTRSSLTAAYPLIASVPVNAADGSLGPTRDICRQERLVSVLAFVILLHLVWSGRDRRRPLLPSGSEDRGGNVRARTCEYLRPGQEPASAAL